MAEEGTTVDLHVIASNADSEFLEMKVAAGMRLAHGKTSISYTAAATGNCCSLTSATGTTENTLIGGFTIFPVNPHADSRSDSTTERGERYRALRTIEILAPTLGITPAELLDGL